jgi:hypothetical protein
MKADKGETSEGPKDSGVNLLRKGKGVCAKAII